eukprot:s345_g20.t1
MKLIRELEAAEKNKQMMLRSLEVADWKQEDKEMADKLKKMFPDTPEELLRPMVGAARDEARLPWTRHQTRRFKKAKGIVLNLFSGPEQSWWPKRMPRDIEVVNVDLLRGQDLLDPSTWYYLLQLVRSGRVVAVLAGPPCRTVSAARYRDDGGPRPVRARYGAQRFGLDTNTVMEQQLADTDSQLWLRTLLLMYEAKLYKPDVKAVVEQTGQGLLIREIHAIPAPQLRTLNLTEEESYLHLMTGHIPYRKDCLQCQVGAGRGRPRRRQKFQSTYEMSVDLAGPFERAPDQGRAKARCFLVATVKVPWMAEIGALVEG